MNYACDLCDDLQFVTVEGKGTIPCPRCKQPVLDDQLRQYNRATSGLPEGIEGVNFENFAIDAQSCTAGILNVLDALLSSSEPQALLGSIVGTPGNGKTRLLYAVANWAIEHKLKVRFYTAISLSFKLSKTPFNQLGDLLDDLATADCLLLDDVSKLPAIMSQDDTVRSQMSMFWHELLDRRYHLLHVPKRTITLLTMNEDYNTFMLSSIVSRLNDGRALTFVNTDPDFRSLL